MNATRIRPGYLAAILITAPITAFASYMAWLIVPIIFREVVVTVVRTVLGA